MEATTVKRRRAVSPIAKAWDLAKKLDNSQKLELMAMLIESVRPAMSIPPIKRYTKAELNAMLDEAEAEIAAGKDTPHEEVMREMDEEIERWEQEELFRRFCFIIVLFACLIIDDSWFSSFLVEMIGL